MRSSSRRVGRVALVDTFADERFETLEAARALTDRLSAVRVDTPASRRGDTCARYWKRSAGSSTARVSRT